MLNSDGIFISNQCFDHVTESIIYLIWLTGVDEFLIQLVITLNR